MAEPFDTIVIGGGLAGLAAALELRARGQRVLVLERESRLGGKAGSHASPAGEFPTGPSSFNGRAPAFWKLVSLLGLEEQVVRLDSKAASRFIVRDGKLQGLKPNPLSLLSTGALTASEKWSLAREFLFPRPHASDADESLRALLERRFGTSVVDHFLEAVMTGIFAGDLSHLSAQACMPALATAEKEYGSILKGAIRSMRAPLEGTRAGLYTFKDGFGVIGQRAEERLTCRLETQVEALTFGPASVRVTTQSERLEARTLVLATDADAASRLLQTEQPELAKHLAAFEYAPLSLVQWAEKTPGDSRLPHGFGYLSAPCERRFALGTLFIGDLRGEPQRRFSTFVGGALNVERASLPDVGLIAGVVDDVRALTGGKVGEVIRVVRWPKAVVQPRVGHLERVATLQRLVSSLPLALAGSYLGGAAMKDALASGFAAAERCAPATRVPLTAPPEGVRATA